ncbi:MAG: alpha/beta hydrolase [Proteobacteria bacterium]|nr:alpha/beta hydrolase [Pseudomonadota bacterium]
MNIVIDKEITLHLKYGGQGAPLLLLHGYPQTHIMWHKIAPLLVQDFTVIMPDLRGYGDSSKPSSDPEHLAYSKRAMAGDQVKLMAKLGHERFIVIAHDRGARVAHRLARDFPDKVKKLILFDMLPTLHIFENIDKEVARAYYHWFFLAQPDNLPETLIKSNAHYYIQEKLKRWSKNGLSVFPTEIFNEYIRCSTTSEAIHAACEDYRAAASIDLIHDEEDKGNKIKCPIFLIWAKNGFIGKHYDVLKVWREWANSVEGKSIDCGHFIPEEAPEDTYQIIYEWLMR